MMKIKNKLATPMSLIAAGLLAMSMFAVTAGDTLRAAEKKDKSLVPQNGILRIANGSIGKTKNVRIVPGKAMVLELPREVRDVLIANPKALDAVVHTSKRVYLIGKNSGQTNAIFFSADGERILTLNVEIGGGRFFDLESIFKRIMPGSDINIEAVGNTVLLTGSVKTPVESSRASSIANSYFTEFKASRASAMSEGNGKVQNKADTRIVNMLTVEGKEQVMLKVRVVEMNRSVTKQFGVNLGAVINSGNLATRLLSENALPLSVAAGLGQLPLPGVSETGDLHIWNPGPGSDFGNSGVHGFAGSGSARLTYAVRALERNGLVRTLAEPALTAISGESAEFLAGGEIPYVTSVDPKTGERSVEFKKFGVQLGFKPVVLSEGRISLKIDTSVSEIKSFVGGNPLLDKRQTKTTVELPSGGSMVLSGLISSDTRQNIDGLPGLKDLPVLGALFRSREYLTKETELVVIVTPYIVKPIANRKMTTPDVGFAPASDGKANLLGHLNRVYGHRQKMPSGRQHGDYGFIVE